MDRSLLANATSQDDAPTPGYMLNEISSIYSISNHFSIFYFLNFFRGHNSKLSNQCSNSRLFSISLSDKAS